MCVGSISYRENDGKRCRSTQHKSIHLCSSVIQPVSQCWLLPYSVSHSSSWSGSRADTISTGTLSTTTNWTASVWTRLRIRATAGWISASAGIRDSAVCRSTSTSAATAAATAASRCGQCRTTAGDCTTCPVVHWTHHLFVPRPLALQLAVWTHRFHLGWLVFSIQWNVRAN